MKDLDKINANLVISILAAGLLVLFLVASLITTMGSDEADPGTNQLAGGSTMAEKSGENVSGHRIEHESDIGRPQSAPHQGPGETTGYSFFRDVEDLGLVFRKRALHPGSAIGYHLHDKDEIYYVLSGEGELTMNGETSLVGPGTAILTRVGDSHGLRQVGEEDLVIYIVYGREVD